MAREIGFPCMRCGAAGSCEHGEVEAPVLGTGRKGAGEKTPTGTLSRHDARSERTWASA